MHFHFLMEICCISFIFYKYKKKKTSEQDNYIEWPRQSRGQFSPLQWKLHKAASKRGKKRLPIFWIHLFEPFVCQCVSCRTPEELRLTFSFPHRVSFICRCWCEVTAAPQLQTPLNKSHSFLLCNTGDDTLFFFFCSNLSRVTFYSHTSVTPVLANYPFIHVWVMSRFMCCQAY